MANPRFLIGFGERLTTPIPPPRSGNPTAMPYTVQQARDRVGRMVAAAELAAERLPNAACPDDHVVTALTLHPQFLSKTAYPARLLSALQFSAVGSRPASIRPGSYGRWKTDPAGQRYNAPYEPDTAHATTRLFLETTRANLRSVAARLNGDEPLDRGEEGVVSVEDFRLNTATDRLRLPVARANTETVAELVLHSDSDLALGGLVGYVAALGLELDLGLELRIATGGLAFVPVTGTQEAVRALADYSFTRVVREMPRMRVQLEHSGSAWAIREDFRPVLPASEPLDRELTVAVFDGGMPDPTPLAQWVTNNRLDSGIGADSDHLAHGQQVTSALLFGNLVPDEPAPVPYCYVDHFPVLDADDPVADPLELYAVLNRIEAILQQRKYEFVNVSIGPEVVVDDEEVHVWTAFWDTFLSGGETFATIAVGNNGQGDHLVGNDRVLVPADSVNGLAIGSADSAGQAWRRADYSAIGPGRAPATVKPDLLAFGGSAMEPFYVLDGDGTAVARRGTSFAAPMAMRAALGARRLFGSRLGALDLKALLIHTAQRHEAATPEHTGHGRVAPVLTDIVMCAEGEARVLYQGALNPSKYLRAQIPLPPGLPSANVTIKATVVFATAVDPADPGNYTRSGLSITFRPHDQRFSGEDSVNARSSSFFRKADVQSEQVQRADSHKWDTVMHAEVRKRASSLRNPVFDIHYNARQFGHGTDSAEPIRYSMVITVQCTKVGDLYERVLGAYATQLQALQPIIDIPVDA